MPSPTTVAPPVRITPVRVERRRWPIRRRRTGFGESRSLAGVATVATLALMLIGLRAPGAAPVDTSALTSARVQAGELASGPSGYTLRYVPPASYVMGPQEAESGQVAGERLRPVTLTRGVWVGEFEVSQALWSRVLGSVPAPDAQGSWLTCARDGSVSLVGPNLPMVCVHWCEVVTFANALSRSDGLEEVYPGGCDANGAVTWDHAANGYRLPTEAEWEWAARGGDMSSPWGSNNSICALGNIADQSASAFLVDVEPCMDGHPRVAAVGTGAFRANGYGLSDMIGNVWEWTWDWYDPTGTWAEHTDPTGPTYRPLPVGGWRTMRGGSWGGTGADARVANRHWADPFLRNRNVGFRLVRSD